MHANDAALDALLGALVERAGVPDAALGDAVASVRRALDRVSQLHEVDPGQDAWAVFAAETAEPLQLTRAEIEKPQCNDGERVKKGQHEAVGVIVEFYTDASPDELRRFCDPTRWHECSVYQRPMRQLEDGVDEERQNGGWRRDLIETVDLLPARALETPLRFTYAVESEDDPDWVHLDYVLLAETDEIAVDEGAIDARRVTGGKHDGRTRVSAKKAILFIDEILREWPTIACDTFWSDLVIAAAVGCPEDGGAPPPGGITMPETQTARLERVIREATKAAEDSIGAYGDLAREAAKQLTSDAPAEADSWLQLTAKTYAQAAGDTVRAMGTYNEVLRILARRSEEPSAPGQSDPEEPDADE